MSKQKLIGLTEETYTRLSLVKRSYSFNAYLEILLNYFEATRIDPRICQESPTVAYLKEIDRLVKIIKSQEKKYTDLLKNINTNTDYLVKIFTDAEKYNNSDHDTSSKQLYSSNIENVSSINNEKTNIDNEEIIKNQKLLKELFQILDELNNERKVLSNFKNYYIWNLQYNNIFLEINRLINSSIYIRDIIMKDCIFFTIVYTEIKFNIDKDQKIIKVMKPLFDKIMHNISNYI